MARSTRTVAVLGTGAMGTGIAHALLSDGHTVRAWNRTRAHADPLTEAGATVFDSPRDAVEGADAAVIMVFDAEAVRAVLDQLAGHVAADFPIIQSATVGLEIDDIAEQSRRHGLTLIDAPVLGNKGPAAAGELSVMAAGPSSTRSVVDPILDTMGMTVQWLGGVPGPASRLKLVCNAWVCTMNAAFCQSLALARELDLDPARYLTAITGTKADSAYVQAKAAAALDQDDEVISPVDENRKDLDLIQHAAATTRLETGLLDSVVGLYARTSDQGYGDRDMIEVRKAFLPPQ